MPTRKEASGQPGGRKRLGRGLTSLISTGVPVATEPEQVTPSTGTSPGHEAIRMIPADRIRPNPAQPRRMFADDALDALAESIRSAGLMQPVVVRPDAAGGFQLVVGERRWRAARKIGLAELPAVVREVDDQTAAEWALVENIQREDLNPLERAEGFQRLTRDYGLTQREVAERVGLKPSTVSNQLRLLELDEHTKQAVGAGRLGVAQALVLLAITNLEARRQLAELAVRKEWSVRTLEQRARSLVVPPRRGSSRSGDRGGGADGGHAHRADLQRRLGEHLGTRVRIEPGRKKGAGRLVIEFYDLDQFEGLMKRLGFAVK